MEGEFLLNDDMPDLVENFINDLINMKEHHIIGLNRCDLDGDKYIVIENIIRNKRLRRELTQTRYAFVDLRGGYDSYCRSMSKNFRRNLNRHEEKICSAGSIRIERMERYCDSKNISKYLSRMFNISLTGWRAKEFGIEEERHHQNFHDYFFPRLALKGMLDISILCIDDKDIAYIVGIIENGVYYEIVTAYNELYKDLSPGTYLIQEILKWCDKNKIHTLISNGDHEYKKRWATEMISQGRLIIFLPGFRSRLGYVAKKSLQPLYYNIKNIFVK
jgi:CelD/BcsL family acetyltransferase involved in cellulose biosynthesis